MYLFYCAGVLCLPRLLRLLGFPFGDLDNLHIIIHTYVS